MHQKKMQKRILMFKTFLCLHCLFLVTIFQSYNVNILFPIKTLKDCNNSFVFQYYYNRIVERKCFCIENKKFYKSIKTIFFFKAQNSVIKK